MPAIERTNTVPGDRQQIWEFLSDFTTIEDWDLPTWLTEHVSGYGDVGNR